MSGHDDGRITPRDRLKGWGLALLLSALIYAYGAIVYFTIGDKGPRPFDYGAADFVPGGSPYSTRPVSTDMWKP